MPGAYAHIAVVNDAQKRAGAAGLRDQTAAALGRFLKFAELGAVSPDYPYLAAMHPAQKKWADAMHYTRTGTLLRSGAAIVAKLPPSAKPKATAWFLGLAGHMTTDMTIHPVVELRVGPYKGNESEHRRCEMHQDAFIFPRVLDLGDTGLTQHLATGIASCHAPATRTKSTRSSARSGPRCWLRLIRRNCRKTALVRASGTVASATFCRRSPRPASCSPSPGT